MLVLPLLLLAVGFGLEVLQVQVGVFELLDVAPLLSSVSSKFNLRCLHDLDLGFKLELFSVRVEFAIYGQLAFNFLHGAPHDLVELEIALNQLHAVPDVAHSMSFKPIEEEVGALVRQIVVDEAKFLHFIWLNLDRLDEAFEAAIRNIVFIEANHLYVRLKVLVLYERTNALDAPIEDAVA